MPGLIIFRCADGIGRARSPKRLSRYGLRPALVQLGYEMLFAQSGQEAIEIYRRERAAGTPVDVAILDLTVPGGMGAVEAARILLDLDPHARLVISTGYSRSPVLANFRSYGFADLIVKPYTMEELGRAIRRVLQ